MGRINTIQTNMTAGELSPRLLGRVDISRYQNAMDTMENAYPLIHGGGNRRPGKQWIAGTKNDAKRSRAIPFVFSSTQTFMLEFGDGYVRFFTNKGQITSGGPAYEIVSPYLEADLPDLNYVQQYDTMFLFHPNYAIRVLKRSSNVLWSLNQAVFVVEPHDEIGISPNTTLTLSSAAVGTGITVTAAATTFKDADVGRPFTSGIGVGVVTGFTDVTHITITITSAFSSTSLASGAWTLGESPKTTITPSVASPVGAFVTLTLAVNGWQNDAVRSDVGRYVHVNGGVVEITNATTPSLAQGIIRSVLTGIIAAQAGYWSEESKIWSATGGYPHAGTLFEQRLVAGGTTSIPNGVWGTKTGLYNDFTPGTADDDGFDFRLVSDQANAVQQLASIKQLIALTDSSEFSIRGGIEKPLTTTNVQTKAETVYGCKNVRPIRVGNELIFVQASGRKVRALSLSATSDNYVSPNISILSEHITRGGITDMCYAQEPDSVVAMVRGDGQMPTLTIEREQEVLGWGRTVTDGFIESCCSIRYGNLNQIWLIVRRTINGATKRYVELMEFNEDFENNRQTDASITGSLAAINTTVLSWAAGVISLTTATPHGLSAGGFARISGAVPAAYNGDYLVASAPSGTQLTFGKEANPGAATTLGTLTPLAKVWGGFSHLEGKTIDILADGVVFPQATVTGGNVTLPRATASIEGGLHYKTTMVTLPPELMLPEGSVQGRPVSISECTVRLYKSIGCKVEAEQVPFRKFGANVLDTPIAPFTGDKQVPIVGWQRGKKITITQDQPLPLCVLAVVKRVTVGD